jgi:hypothetical protein
LSPEDYKQEEAQVAQMIKQSNRKGQAVLTASILITVFYFGLVIYVTNEITQALIDYFKN